MIPCPSCERTFRSAPGLASHIAWKHPSAEAAQTPRYMPPADSPEPGAEGPVPEHLRESEHDRQLNLLEELLETVPGLQLQELEILRRLAEIMPDQLVEQTRILERLKTLEDLIEASHPSLPITTMALTPAEASVRRRAGPRSPAAQRPLADQMETIFQGINDLTALVGLLSEQVDGIAGELAAVRQMVSTLVTAVDPAGDEQGDDAGPTVVLAPTESEQILVVRGSARSPEGNGHGAMPAA